MSKLTNYRHLNKMSQSILSKRSGVSVRTIQAYEQGAKDINKASIKTIKMIANALNITPDDLFETVTKRKKSSIGKTIVVGMGFVGKAVFNYLASKEISVDSYDIKDIKEKDYRRFDSVIICVPTNLKDGNLDTSNVESTIQLILEKNTNVDIYIKSTLPIGTSKSLINKYEYKRIFYVPEFLREKTADYDISHPYRIVIGTNNKQLVGVDKYLSLFEDNVEKVVTGFDEAEAIKLFSNSYLALKVAFFNEVDTVLSLKEINSKDVIHGISLDPRIGNFYNNPSYGIGGTCLPKDVKALSNMVNTDVIQSIDRSNLNRKKYIVQRILKMVENIDCPVVGIYSINTRKSALIEIINSLIKLDIKIIIYSPLVNDSSFERYESLSSKHDFIFKSDVILSESKCDFDSNKLLVFNN